MTPQQIITAQSKLSSLKICSEYQKFKKCKVPFFLMIYVAKQRAQLDEETCKFWWFDL